LRFFFYYFEINSFKGHDLASPRLGNNVLSHIQGNSISVLASFP